MWKIKIVCLSVAVTLLVDFRVTNAQDAQVATAPSTATYMVTFDATWSAATHPTDFPPNPHFSGLIGGTHNSSVSFWEVGQLASTGIESMAETGSKTNLQNEVNAAITAGTAEFVLSGNGIGTSPDDVSLTFDVTEAYPLVTLVSMLAPSPDWFVGVTGLDLFDGGSWSASEVVPLLVHDAGTDDGTTYTSANDDADPPQNVSVKTTTPFDVSNQVGTFTFTLQSVLPVELSRFDAVADGPVVELTWRTESERDNAGFEVEHAVVAEVADSDVPVFERVGFVAGYGTSSAPNDYGFTVAVDPWQHLFRLKQIDFDGAFRYGPVVEATVFGTRDLEIAAVYPNPLHHDGVVSIRSARAQDVQVELVDMLGRRINYLYRGTLGAQETKTVRVDRGRLPVGLYVVRLGGASTTHTRTVLIGR